jgi:peptidoglycan/xylan/chitin deacetylase (PgdA/CDA1 family)
MRIDRLLTLALFYPAIKWLRRDSELRIPILMYHGISKQLDDHLHPYFRTVTSPERFEQQMRFLSENSYEVLTLSEAVHLLQDQSPRNSTKDSASFGEQRHIVVITFDDGLRDFYSAAFPILEKFGFKATVFLTSGLIGKTFPTGSECLRETEIKELASKGIEFGSHTESHPQLKKLSEDKILHELSASKATIEAILKSPVTLFSYPYKFPEEDHYFTKNLAALLVILGYSSEVTTIIGTVKTSDNPFFLKRLPINDCDDMRFFHAKLAGAYNWLHIGQLAYKRLKGNLRG